MEDKAKAQTPSHRGGTRYKEKFQSLREKYDQVTAIHEDYQRDLEIAHERIRKLQAENDLLLDAMHLAAPSQPALLQYIVPMQHQQLYELRPERPIANHGSRNHHNHHDPPHSSLGLNGNSNGNSRHHPVEPPDGPPGEFGMHETNGRVS